MRNRNKTPKASMARPFSPRVSLGWFAGLLLGAGTPAGAASFDCQNASTSVERALCADAELSALDSTLGAHYERAMANLEPDQREALRSRQRAWLHIRDACGDARQTLVACLQPLLRQRVIDVGQLTQPDTAALDAIIASIPYRPTEAAEGLRRYPTNELAAAWRVYLHRFEPASGVTQGEADGSRRQVLAALASDDYPRSLFDDLERDQSVSRDRVELTLLRMMIERAEYAFFADQRAYVHCFVFSRQGDAAYDAFGPLYGSTRDSFAPICEPLDPLFEQAPWQQLSSSVDEAVSAASENSGTVRFASYADWNLLALRATSSPRAFLKAPAAPAQALEQIVRDWNDETSWPTTLRQQALAALEPARQVTSTWLQHEHGFSADEAQQAAAEIVRQWLSQRLDFISENVGGE
ncbi:MAG: lysozyme inhibitor LprI family protein [Pseudomonas sp.]|uniref:lysozyme inhibitor LprI family protein n=1 Tax=Pseudomonas sp. TaxID=306 RepID=UPI00339B1B5F